MTYGKGWKDLPIAGVITESGTSVQYKTGDWRSFRPVVDASKCTSCFICWIYCPEPAILRKEKGVEIDYNYCKGCGICSVECPSKAITMQEESR